MTIAMTGYNSAELVTLVDAVARVYAAELGSMERTVRLDRVNKITAIIDKLSLFVNREKKDFLAWIETTGAANAQQRQNQADFDRQRLARLIQQKVDARVLLDKLTLEDEQNKKGEGPRVKQSEIIRALEESKEIQDQKAKVEKLQNVLAARMRLEISGPKLQENRDEIQKAKDDLAALERKLTPDIKKGIADKRKLLGEEGAEDNRHEIAATNALIKMIDEQVDVCERSLKQEGPQTFEIEERKARYASEDRVVDSLRTHKAFLQAEAEQAAGSARVEGPAAMFAQQDVKKQIMMASGAGIGAMALVLFVIAYWEFRVRRINTGEDVVNGLGWRLVGQLPPLPERSRGGLLRKQGDAQYYQNLMTESVDATRTMILHAARVEGLRTVMVTSAVSGEGKTSLSCHLACSLARAGRKTLLLDCDMRNPAAHRLFELPSEPGLCEVLRGEAQLADVIRATPATNLWMIPAGQFDEQALQTFTLSQDGFSPLLEQLKSQFDFIVIDSSPVLPVVDTLVVAQNVDVVVFSLLRDVSRIPSVYAAYQRLATLGVRILGAVVNGVETGSYGYSHSYAKPAAS
jgi:capsular exopolysaccharide synthesis family protein